jgi:hypothetical protein
MPASKSHNDPTFGFISVTDLGGGTLIGGYLILNKLGRPLEFHCTEPVKPSRAQQILFGSALAPYLYGEQIGQALVQHSELAPQLVLTNQRDVLELRMFIDIPVAWLNTALQAPPGCIVAQMGSQQVFVDQRHDEDRHRIEQLYQQTQPQWNLEEPFQRIHEAVAELQKAA